MRPLRLTITAFGPYAGTEVVDFDALTELGLFVVAGNNGSGKTTIFDALHYALYGTLPGRRATYIRLKSDHADGSVECSVTLDFAAHNQHWRVARSPKQHRPKRRGTGTTEAPAAATLYRLDGGVPVAVTNRVEEVRAKCTELVGLSGKQFERVALLPQGQFSRVLSESSADRRELLRTLFSSEVFGDATNLLAERAADATAADRSVLERLDHQQAALAEELSALTAVSVPDDVAALTTSIEDFRRGRLAELAAQVMKLEAEATAAQQAKQHATDLKLRVERRAQVQRELEHHHQHAADHDRDVQRLQQARAAVPVTSNARTLAGHEQHLESCRTRLNDLHAKIATGMAAAGCPPLADFDEPAIRHATATLRTLGEGLAKRSEAAKTVSDFEHRTNQTHGELRKIANELRALSDQHELAESQLRQATAELARLADASDLDQSEQALRDVSAQLEQRSELASLESAHGEAVRTATELDGQIESLEQQRDRAHEAQTTYASLQAKADKAYDELESCTRRHAAAERFAHASANLLMARRELDAARASADDTWNLFIAGTAARVADTLTEGDPCPVCGSADHPDPAQPDLDASIVTEADVQTVRAVADQAQAAVRSIEVEIEALRATDPDIAALSVSELAAQITTIKAMALGARAVADEARQAASTYSHVAENLAATITKRRTLEDQLREVDSRRSRLQGALGAVANEPVADLRSRVEAARAERALAEERSARSAELTKRIAAAEAAVESSALEQLAAKSRQTSAQDQLGERQRELDTAMAELKSVDDELVRHLPQPSVSPAGTDVERRAQAVRKTLDLLAEATTAVALQRDASDAVRRATSVLNDRLAQSSFATLDAAMAAFIDPEIVDQLEAQTTHFRATDERLRGQLHELSDTPEVAPELGELTVAADRATQSYAAANRSLITTTTTLDRLAKDLDSIVTERKQRQSADASTQRLERVAALVKGDNDRNTSLENWVLAAHLRDVVELANVRLARSTHQRFQLCVLDDGENRRGKWGLDLGVEDTVTGTRRPTAGLSGGELFQASLALALGLADAVMNQTAGVRIDALFIDEGFGSLDETSVERAIDLLDELRDRGAMVGVITHVPALLDALPLGVSVVEADDGQGSTIQQRRLAA